MDTVKIQEYKDFSGQDNNNGLYISRSYGYGGDTLFLFRDHDDGEILQLSKEKSLEDLIITLNLMGFHFEYLETLDLVTLLRENFEPKEFKKGDLNYCFRMHLHKDEDQKEFVSVECRSQSEIVGAKYFNKKTDIDLTYALTQYKVKGFQLKEAMKSLGWI